MLRQHRGDGMREPTEMEMRVAEAILGTLKYAEGAKLTDLPSAGQREIMLNQARAAIQAMRAPTDKMVDAGIDEDPYGCFAVWVAMIDTASPPITSGTQTND